VARCGISGVGPWFGCNPVVIFPMFSRLPIAAVVGLFLTVPGLVLAQGSPGGFWQKYDTNKDGSLDPAEIPQGMKGLVEKSATKFGLDPTKPISIEQLQGGSPAAGPTTPAKSGEQSATAPPQAAPPTPSTNPPKVRKARRFLTAAERLPKGIPAWFTEADKNRDGQVMMHEFVKSWSEAKAKEFATHDQNGDGIITAKEALSPAKRAEGDSDGDRNRDRPRRSRRN
jgi:hypothetical protein